MARRQGRVRIGPGPFSFAARELRRSVDVRIAGCAQHDDQQEEHVVARLAQHRTSPPVSTAGAIDVAKGEPVDISCVHHRGDTERREAHQCAGHGRNQVA